MDKDWTAQKIIAFLVAMAGVLFLFWANRPPWPVPEGDCPYHHEQEVDR